MIRCIRIYRTISGFVPSFAHGMAVPGAVAGAITDVATNYFNSKTSPAEGKAQLVAAIQAAIR